MNNSRIKSSLSLIVLLFLFTRFYKINEIPLSVYWDEASIGYNAYSILQTGRDEWGNLLPIHFRAFGEFKLPIYIYSVVPFIKIFGLNEFSVRLPAVLFSLGVAILTFFLAKKITGSNTMGLWGGFFITVSPWFFIFSRTGYEATAGLMFYLLAILLFLQIKKRGIFILFSIASFIISAYSYNSFRIVSPLTILVLLFYVKMDLKEIVSKYKLYILISGIILILSAIPIVRLYVYDAGISRLQVVGGVSDFTIVKNYFAHFNPDFLFIQGDSNLRHQQVGFGQLYLPELALLLAGIAYILRSKSKYSFFSIVLILLGAIPAAITKESPHSLRSLSMVPFIHIISAIGVVNLEQILRKKPVLNVAIILIFLSSFLYYFINFLTVYPIQSADSWQYGYKKIFTDPNLKSDKREKINISDENGQPYIFALFYLKYDPEKFRDEVVRNSVDKWGFSTVKSFGKFEFGENR